MITFPKLPSLLSVSMFCIALSSGYLSGRLLSIDDATISFIPDTRPPVPVLEIEGVRNGLLHGHIIGSARIVMGDTVLTQSGVFALDAASLLVNEISVNVPSWAEFVASKSGTRYYPVDSARGQGITPKNRVYFRSDIDAERAGFLPPS